MVPVMHNPRVCSFFHDTMTWPVATGAWTGVSSGGGTILNNSSAATYQSSIIQLATGAGASARAAIMLPNSGSTYFNYWTALTPAYLNVRMRVSQARTNEFIWVGLTGSDGAVGSSPANGIFFRKVDTGSEADWQSVTRAGGTEAGSANSITGFKDANWHNFQIRILSSSSIAFYIDDVLKFTHSGNIPATTTPLKLVVIIDETSSADRRVEVEDVVWAHIHP
jgi:hypothetical protein